MLSAGIIANVSAAQGLLPRDSYLLPYALQNAEGLLDAGLAWQGDLELLRGENISLGYQLFGFLPSQRGADASVSVIEIRTDSADLCERVAGQNQYHQSMLVHS